MRNGGKGNGGREDAPLERLTITDVARRANVSIGTVSNVINGTRPVSNSRRASVLQAIEEIGYAPNLFARSLRRGQQNVIGICMPFANSAYFDQLIAEYEQLAARDGREIIHVFARREQKHQLEKISWLMTFKIGGLLFLPSTDSKEALDTISRASVPAVIVDRPVNDDRFDQVTIDSGAAMREIVFGLSARGHRSLAFLTQSNRYLVTERRIRAMEQAAADIGDLDATVLEADVQDDGLAGQLHNVLGGANPATALIFSSSTLAGRTVRLMRSFRVPRTRWPTLLCFDDPEWADLVEPPLSVLRHPVGKIALELWEFLMQRQSGYAGKSRHLLLSAIIDLGGAKRAGGSEMVEGTRRRAGTYAQAAR